MKVVSWNSSGPLGQRNRLEQLFALNPDIAIVPECSLNDVDILRGQGLSADAIEIKPKALGIFARNGIEVEPCCGQGFDFRGVAPFRVSGPVPFTLMAVWAVAQFGPYAKQLHTAFESQLKEFSEGPIVVAGDFNTTSFGQKPGRALKHRDLVDLLDKHGLESVYHGITHEAHGTETLHTYHHQWKSEQPFHIDYIFAPRTWVRNVREFSVGPHAFWSEYSDHRPVCASFALPAKV